MSAFPSSLERILLAGEPHSKKRRLGVYYTPQWLADLLVDWALANGPGSILDPSFGGCAFLEAARRALVASGAANPNALVYGFDIDRAASKFADQLIAQGVPRENLVRADFLSDRAANRFSTFRAVVGNPPYVRHHLMSDASIERAQLLIRRAGFSLSRTAGAWAYFTLLAAAYVQPGGRLALILPGAILQTHYGHALLSQLATAFGQIRLLHVHERLFEDTDEETLIILASDRGQQGSIAYQRVSQIEELPSIVRDATGDTALRKASEYKLALLDDDSLAAWQEARTNPLVVSLGEIATVRIGVVTGANDFFLRNSRDPILKNPNVSSLPVVTSKRALVGPTITRADLNAIDRAGAETRLAFIRKRGKTKSTLRRQIDAAEAAGLSGRHHCSLRTPWFSINDRERPDIFLPYMSGGHVYMTKNDAGAVCTNAVHRVTLLEGCSRSASSAVAASFSSLFAFESELLGRSYGGGILKVEPGAATALTILDRGASRVYEALSRHSTFDATCARDYADEHILKGILGLSKASIKAIRKGERALAGFRSRPDRD